MAHYYSPVDASWDVIDPNPDIHAMFVEFNREFFFDLLVVVEVIWSEEMTLYAGLCNYEGYPHGMCTVVLSKPLLKLRPRRDLAHTLLHEMIHAFLFVVDENDEDNAHGPMFQLHMNRINQLAGTNITIDMSCHVKVDHDKTHGCKDNGACQNCSPLFASSSGTRQPSTSSHLSSSTSANSKSLVKELGFPSSAMKKDGKKPDVPIPASGPPKRPIYKPESGSSENPPPYNSKQNDKKPKTQFNGGGGTSGSGTLTLVSLDDEATLSGGIYDANGNASGQTISNSVTGGSVQRPTDGGSGFIPFSGTGYALRGRISSPKKKRSKND